MNAPGKRILVTGATGFLGGAICRELRAHGCRVVAAGRDTARLAELAHDGCETCAGDLGDEGVADDWPRVDGAVHAAALSSPWGRAAEFERSNVRATRHILEVARRERWERLVFVSSPSIYHRGIDQLGLTEETPWPRRAVNHYAASKRVAEFAVRESGVPTVILRPRALYGPRDTVLLPRIVRAAGSGRLPVIGRGDNITDLTYVDNAAHAVRLALECPLPGRGWDDFNITDGQPVALWPTLAALLPRLGVAAPRRRRPRWLLRSVAAAAEAVGALRGREPVLTRYGVDVLSCSQTFDLTKARERLGYTARVGTTEGLDRFTAWWNETRAVTSA